MAASSSIRVALDLPYWAICSASYRLIRMAIKMAREAGACFSFINFMSCITVAKWPCYGPLKIKPSYNIVLYYVLILFVYYGGPPTAMNAVLAIISDGKWAIIVINREVVQINYFLLYFIDSDKTLWWWPLPTPCEEAPGGVVCSSIKTMPLEGETGPSWWGCLCACV
jgi:hypothetical protein